jgi:hypothetical protein
MAEVLIHSIEFLDDNPYGTFLSGDVIDVYADTDLINASASTSSEGIKAYLNGSGTPLTSGAYIPLSAPIIIRKSYNTQLCSGNSLIEFYPNSLFAYQYYKTYANHPVCSTPAVCDLLILGTPQVVPATTDTAEDGEITITASSSHTIEYKLGEDFIYGNGQASGTFADLRRGSYRIFLRDSNNCGANILVDVPVDNTYGTKYRLEYTDNITGFSTKIEIGERGYASTVEEICGSGDPFQIQLRGEGNTDKFTQLLSSNAVLNLTSETNNQFIDLYTNDINRFRMYFYKDTGSGYSLKWTGRVLPFNYQEDYKAPPYYASVLASCGLAQLKELFFFNDDGTRFYGTQKLIKIVAFILQKTGILLDIRVGINMYASGMNTTATDDPLYQAYVDVDAFYIEEENPTLEFVLQSILKPFGARVVQWNNYWNILRVEELTAAFDYRKFDYLGDYESNGSLSLVRNIDYPDNGPINFTAFPNMELQKGYGRIRVNYKLGLKSNILDNGDFRVNMTYDSGLNTYTPSLNTEGWSLVNAGYPIITELGTIDENNVSWDLRVNEDITNVSTVGQAYILSKPYNIKMGTNNTIKFTVRYNIKRKTALSTMPDGITFPYVKVRMMVQYGSLYLTSTGSWSSTTARVEFIETKLNEWIEREIVAQQPTTGTPLNGMNMTVRLYHGHPLFVDYLTISAVEGLATDGVLPDGHKIAMRDSFDLVNDFIYYYELEQISAVLFIAGSSYDCIIPSDYDGTTNKRGWVLKYKRPIDVIALEEEIVFGIDKVTAQFLTDGQTPIDGIVRSTEAEPLNAEVLEEDLILGSNADLIQRDFVLNVIPSTREKLTFQKYLIERFKQTKDKDTKTKLLAGRILYTQGSATINYETLNILSTDILYTGWLRNSSGTAWDLWTRDGIPEAEKLHAVWLKQQAAQYNETWRLLRATLTSKTQAFGLLDIFKEVNDNNRIYLPISVTLDDKNNSYSAELLELKEVLELEDADEAGFTTGFSLGYNA